MKPSTKAIIREYIESIVIALILALLIRTFVVQAFKIPTGSMRPTLLEGDRILVNRFIYRFQKPQRGDVIVFKFPDNPKRDFIKRLIATEGESVEIRSGDIYVNGELMLVPPQIRDRFYYNRGVFGQEGMVVIVPEDSFFVLGDNSGSSKDSRYWGFVPKRYLVGKAFFIYWPLTRWRVIH
ncbi:MAG: signal peptidase I [Candidatus Omnitrophica bacterium]|nr:signal peptidase I [Candidatus Omnitrophota bacterium]